MTLAVVAAMANGPTHIRGVESWRVKETERMAAIVAELTKLGCEVCSLLPPTSLTLIPRDIDLPCLLEMQQF